MYGYENGTDMSLLVYDHVKTTTVLEDWSQHGGLNIQSSLSHSLIEHSKVYCEAVYLVFIIWSGCLLV